MNEKLVEIAHELMLHCQAQRGEIHSLHATVSALQQAVSYSKEETENVRKQWRNELDTLRRKLRLCDMPSCYTPGCTSDHK